MTRNLPLNREERYYSAHLLPAIVGCNNLNNIDRFLRRCGVSAPIVDPERTVHMVAEYNTLKSLKHAKVAKEFLDHPTPHCGIDLLIHVVESTPALVFVEAKMFDLAADLDTTQMPVQRTWLDYLGEYLGIAPENRHHVALLPDSRAKNASGAGYVIVRWEDVLDDYRELCPPFLLADLSAALSGYADLVSKGWTSGIRMRGSDIYRSYHAGTLGSIKHVGRDALRGQGSDVGINGSGFAVDLASGEWLRFKYAVSDAAAPPNPKWFSVQDFVQRIDAHMLVRRLSQGEKPAEVAAAWRAEHPDIEVRISTLAEMARLLQERTEN